MRKRSVGASRQSSEDTIVAVEALLVGCAKHSQDESCDQIDHRRVDPGLERHTVVLEVRVQDRETERHEPQVVQRGPPDVIVLRTR